MLDLSPFPLIEHGEGPDGKVKAFGKRMFKVPFAAIWLTVVKENRQRVLAVPISLLRQVTDMLRGPGAAE